MANFDDLKLSVEAMTGGKNTVLLDDRGMPSIMVAIPKMKFSELVKDSVSQSTHPGFIVGGEEKKVMYVSKFQNIVIGDRAYSMPFKDPKTSVNFDKALGYCRNKGNGWSLMPYSLWCAIALWCRANETMPRGNNFWGHDHAKKHESGVETSKEGAQHDSHPNETARTATGSGPDTWNHNWLPDGIADMNGNVWEWCAGMRLKDGVIHVVADADVMKPDVKLTVDSTSWKSINDQGILQAPTAEKSLKWDWDGTSKLKLTNNTVTFTKDEGHGCSFKDMILDTGHPTAAPELAKALLLYPDDPGKDVYGGDYHWANIKGERLPLCGGAWSSTGSAGVFRVHLSYVRSGADGGVGFRSVYCDL